jgi:hypothetical protein
MWEGHRTTLGFITSTLSARLQIGQPSPEGSVLQTRDLAGFLTRGWDTVLHIEVS